MKLKFALMVLSLALVGLTSMTAYGQSTEKPKSDIRTLTGCLTQGGSADAFNLAADDGSTWVIHSSKVALSKHVGHTVSVTGVVQNSKMHNMKEDTKDAAVDSGVKKDDSEHGHLKATNLKMVSESCKS
jgi:hypothetical protein